jgi:hypothetical protein
MTKHCCLFTALLLLPLLSRLLYSQEQTNPQEQKGDDATTRVHRLLAKWESAHNEVLTANLSVYSLLLVIDNKQKSPTRVDVISFLQESLVPFIDSGNDITILQERLNAFSDASGIRRGLWTKLYILHDNSRTRNDLTYFRNANIHVETRVRDAAGEVAYRNNDAHATSSVGRSKVHLVRFDEIRFIPTFGPNITLTLQSEISGIMAIEPLESKGTVIVKANADTGFVHSASGPIHDVLQYAPRVVNGVTIPGLRADLVYFIDPDGTTKRLRSAQIYIVDVAQVNEELADEQFSVGVPPNVSVIRHQPGAPPVAKKTTEATSDVKSFAETIPHKVSSRTSVKGMTICVASIMLGIAAIAIYRRVK